MSKQFLRELPLFAGLTDADIDRLYDMAEQVTLKAGEVLIDEGARGDSMYIALEGMFDISKRTGETDVVIAGCGPGDVIGEISLVEDAPRTATVRAIRDARLLKISRSTFEQLLSWSGTAALAVLRVVTLRLRNTETMLRQREKLASLGTLAAGLAHELNNPAAAVRRSSSQLRESMSEWLLHAASLGQAGLDAAQAEKVNMLRSTLPERSQALPRLDPLERSDREGLITDWLEERGVDNSWEIAPSLVALGWQLPEVEDLAAGFGPAQLSPLMSWLGTGCAVYTLLEEVQEGAERISEIVKAVKSYSYLDQAPVQMVDIHEALENTLIILRHKLKQGVTVTKAFAPDLPRVEAYGGELNQVWTNLIDNAIDAVEGKGAIEVRTHATDGKVSVSITDNGPGIPPEIKPRLFDAFFTTKAPGVGTGLGLNIAYNIIVNQHRGNIDVKSEPGATTFEVTLPVRMSSSG